MVKPIESDKSAGIGTEPTLARSLSLPLLVLYGLGVTVGAGIYVLIGGTAEKAGYYAPISFVVAAIVVSFTGFSYAELSTRFPVSAGEAAYVKEGFRSPSFSLLVGLMVVVSGVVSSAAVTLGSAAYLHAYIPVSEDLLLAIVIVIVGLIAIWGILESVRFAALITLIEIGGLGLVVAYAFIVTPDLLNNAYLLIPPFEVVAWSGIFSAGLLAFFAFVGFEDIANIAEEVKQPKKTLPWGILLTLILATTVYLIVVSVVILMVPMSELLSSTTPLSLVFASAPPWIKGLFGLIAFFATINGALIQIIMASRVLYGLGKQGSLPSFITYISPRTRTPITASLIIIGLIVILAYTLPIVELAEMTSIVVLLVFTLVNLALIRIKLLDGAETAGEVFYVPLWVPILGSVTSLGLLMAGFLI
ncbi:MAG: amino acid permease [Sneathiella sp.]